MLRDVTHVQHLGGHRLRIAFDDGVEGEIDLARHLTFDGVFAPLADPSFVAQVAVDPEVRTLRWPNGADLDSLVLYARVTGRSIPELLAAEDALAP